MNFDFSDEQKQLREEARRFLTDRCSPAAVRAILEGPESFDRALWKGLAEMGFLGAAIPEEYGGVGLGHLELCVIAEELGRVVAPVPMASSIYLAAEFLMAAGTEEQKSRWLPKLASGETIGCFAWSEGVGRVTPKSIRTAVSGGTISGAKAPVADGDVAGLAIVAARSGTGTGENAISLYLVDLTGAGVSVEAIDTIDPTRSQSRIVFDGAPAELLGPAGEGWAIASQVMDRAAVLVAFEQVGGSEIGRAHV